MATRDDRSDQRSRSEAEALIGQVSQWRHRIAVGDGMVTPGYEDTSAEWNRVSIPADLAGRRVLDIGCSDGYYSFRCEDLGADVVAIDDQSSFLAANNQNGFRIAASLRASNVDYRAADVHALDPEEVGMFDDVLFLNVLYHLQNPVLALQRIAAVTNPGGRLFLKTYYRTDVRVWLRGRCIGFDLDRRPKWWFFPNSELGGDPTNWWAPNRRGLLALLEATGWVDAVVTRTWRDRLYVHATRAR